MYEIRPRPALECRECTRCGGTGHYSFNPVHGSVCYGCGGLGWKYTKRGAAALDYFRSLITVATRDLAIGTVILDESVFGNEWVTVDGVEISDDGTYKVHGVGRKSGEGCSFGNWSADSRWRVAQTKAEKAAKIAQAVEYEKTLTARGEPRKTRRAS